MVDHGFTMVDHGFTMVQKLMVYHGRPWKTMMHFSWARTRHIVHFSDFLQKEVVLSKGYLREEEERCSLFQKWPRCKETYKMKVGGHSV